MDDRRAAGSLPRTLFAAGALAGLSAVAMASAASHALSGLAPTRLQLLRTALQIHGWHALAILMCAVWLPRGGRWTVAAAICFIVGLIVFCSAVYGLGLYGWHVAMAAPFGGSLLLTGWLLLAAGCVFDRR